MFDQSNFDLTIILSSTMIILNMLENGNHTLTEKPISLRLEHAEELDYLAKKKQSYGWRGFPK